MLWKFSFGTRFDPIAIHVIRLLNGRRYYAFPLICETEINRLANRIF